MIALGIHPSAGPPPKDIVGNRRGTFAATPAGKPGAAGTPDIRGDAHSTGNGGTGSGKSGAGSGSNSHSGIPAGVFVGAGPKDAATSSVAGAGGGNSPGGSAGSGAAAARDPVAIASARPPHVTALPRRAMAATSAPTELEREVFGNRKFYGMVLNMPNLNSAGGSWVIRFAELKTEQEASELMAPEAIHKVDPGYPLELMRTRVEGNLTLYAVIRSDGSVGSVRVLSSPDERLDGYARNALARWQFRPATRNGTPVDLEAVVQIPFRTQHPF